MARTILDCWEMMSGDNASARTLPPRMYEYMVGSPVNDVSHVFGQSNIDAWQAKNSKIRNDESVEAQSLKDFRDNNL
jgi:hypothetical protein